MSKKVYLAGKVTKADADFEITRARFRQRQTQLERKGYNVFNPVEEAISLNIHNEPWAYIMRVMIPVMLRCDEVHVMPCWKESKGAVTERDLALKCELPVVYL